MEKATFIEYRDRINSALRGIPQTSIDQSIAVISKTIENNNRIWIAGNGGSAATASHFATDLNRCTNSENDPVKGISLCDNLGLITAIGNDFGYEHVFSRQLMNLATRGDLLVVLTASGNSKNILNAMEWAKSQVITSLALTGFEGGRVRALADISLHVETAIGDYGVAEDAHSILCHFLSSQFKVVS